MNMVRTYPVVSRFVYRQRAHHLGHLSVLVGSDVQHVRPLRFHRVAQLEPERRQEMMIMMMMMMVIVIRIMIVVMMVMMMMNATTLT